MCVRATNSEFFTWILECYPFPPLCKISLPTGQSPQSKSPFFHPHSVTIFQPNIATLISKWQWLPRKLGNKSLGDISTKMWWPSPEGVKEEETLRILILGWMLNGHDANTCLLTSRESKFGSFLCISKMTCLLSLEVTVATTSERWLLQSGIVADLCLSPPFMWTKCGNSVPSFMPWKWERKKVGRSEEWRTEGKRQEGREGRRKSHPHFVFTVQALKGCLSRSEYGSSFWVLSLPWYFPS